MLIFLSPHFDDAVFSCGGTIHKLTHASKQAQVITIMGGNAPETIPETPIVQELHRRWQEGNDPIPNRKAEDRAALAKVGAQDVIHVDLPDCVYRAATNGNALYPTEESLFGDIHPDDPATRKINEIQLAFNQITKLYCPLGVGNHVDHQIVRNWAIRLMRQYPSLPVAFYEDYPYSIDQTKLAHTLSYLGSALQNPFEPLTEANINAKIEAMICYRSQINTFWSNPNNMKQEVRAFFFDPAQNSPAEKFWYPEEAGFDYAALTLI